jgi:molybdate transport system substrate-binding protein
MMSGPAGALARLALAALFAASAAACTAGASEPPGAAGPPASGKAGAAPVGSGARPAALTIYGAASLTEVLDAAKAAYEAANPGTSLTISTDASSALETKIELGAQVDVFLSADTANPQALVDQGLTDGEAVDFARNELTVVVPASNPAAIRTPADLARPGVKIVAAGDAVPITKYANQLVANLAVQPGYPPDFVAAYEANVVSREDNVKAAVAKVELGEGDAAIAYVTDAKTSTKVSTVGVPEAANVFATYAGVVVKDSPATVAAHAFLSWLAGPGGQAILAGFGFLPPS